MRISACFIAAIVCIAVLTPNAGAQSVTLTEP
jgi:hypothetical protein